PDQKWVADISYLPTGEGWLFLAVVLDLFSRKVIGWAMAATMPTSLVLQALRMALAARQTGQGLLHHSDQGSQYASQAYQSLLAAYAIEVSMSRTGNCYDNAVIESFWATLKAELPDVDQPWSTRTAAQSAVFLYLEGYYNARRRHSTLGYLSPVAYEQQWRL